MRVERRTDSGEEYEPVPERLLRAFETSGVSVHAAQGDVVISNGDECCDVYLVARGSVRFTLMAEDGKEPIFRDTGVRTLFGELSAIDGQARSVMVTALEDSHLLRLAPDEYMQLLTNEPEVTAWSMRMMSARIRELTKRNFELSALTVTQRIRNELIRMSRAQRPPDPGGKTRGVRIIQDFPTHAVIAAQLGTHREAVTRELRSLTAAGIVAQDGRCLHILDMSQLKAST